MKIISTTAKIDAISFTNQAGHSVAPTSGNSKIYTTISGLYLIASGIADPVSLAGVGGRQQGIVYCRKSNIQYISDLYPRLRFDNIQVDDDNTITTGASWKFTAPYDCYATIYLQTAISFGIQTYVRHYVNDSLKLYSNDVTVGTWGSHRTGATFKMSSGDYYYVRYGLQGGVTHGTVNAWCRITINYMEQ